MSTSHTPSRVILHPLFAPLAFFLHNTDWPRRHLLTQVFPFFTVVPLLHLEEWETWTKQKVSLLPLGPQQQVSNPATIWGIGIPGVHCMLTSFRHLCVGLLLGSKGLGGG